MRIAYFGTGDFSRNILENILKDNRVTVDLVVSQPDKPVGRKKEILPTPVKALAVENNIEVLQPERLKENTEFFSRLDGYDFIVVVAYGKIVPNEVLDAPKHGCINIHGSILPKYRGASPIQEAVKNGDIETGLTIMYMSEGMDEGDVLEIGKTPIDIMDKTPDIFKKFEDFGAELLINTLEKVLAGEITPIKQNDDEATYCSKISKADGKINFKEEAAKEIYDKFRSYSPWPGIFSYYNKKKFSIDDCFFNDIDLSNDEELNPGDVIELDNEHGPKNTQIGIICKSGVLILKQVKLEGKKSMDINVFVNGNKDFLDYSF